MGLDLVRCGAFKCIEPVARAEDLDREVVFAGFLSCGCPDDIAGIWKGSACQLFAVEAV